MPGETVESNKNDMKNDTIIEVSQNSIEEIFVDSIEGRTCYFSLAGDLAIKAFEILKYSTFDEKKKKAKTKVAFMQRLDFAVLMFDHVVIHCSDPLRSEIVLEVLEEKIEWIKEGRILFIFSNSIKNIKRDYSAYIERKIKEYQGGYFSEKEADSLKQGHITEKYFERVIKLLENTPWLVRKSQNKDFEFHKLLLDDLNYNHEEQVIVDTDADLSQVLSLSLSLYQLMHTMKYQVTSSDNADEYVFPNNIVKKVIKTIKQHLGQENTIARTAIVDSLKDELKNQELTDIQENILNAISLRMDVLYCHMNSGKQLILEFHPSYEQRSIYRLDCFLNFMNSVAESDKKLKLNDGILKKILEDSDLESFRLCYLVSMADTYEHINLDQHEFRQRSKKILNVFDEISNKNIKMLFYDRFGYIKKVLNGEI